LSVPRNVIFVAVTWTPIRGGGSVRRSGSVHPAGTTNGCGVANGTPPIHSASVTVISPAPNTPSSLTSWNAQLAGAASAAPGSPAMRKTESSANTTEVLCIAALLRTGEAGMGS
jgi:hypothetical protein